jgi:hypothetical protein
MTGDHGSGVPLDDGNADFLMPARPRQAFEFRRDHLQPLGYRLAAMIVDWPHGIPGDIGLFLRW